MKPRTDLFFLGFKISFLKVRSSFMMILRVGLLVGFGLCSNLSCLYASPSPHLLIEAPEALQPIVNRLERVAPLRFQPVMDLLGLPEFGTPIRVIVAPEQSEWAKRAPPWASGYALPQFDLIVILPERVVSYPYDSLETVLGHEVAHILLRRAAGGQAVPRWFDEGVAMIGAHQWDWESQARLAWWAMGPGEPLTLEEVNARFHQDETAARQAYVLAHALVRFLIQQFGHTWPRDVLASLAQQGSFQEAFVRTTLWTPDQAEAAFWNTQTAWIRWVPTLTSSLALWLGIAALAIYVFRKQRQRAKIVKQQWKDDDDCDP